MPDRKRNVAGAIQMGPGGPAGQSLHDRIDKDLSHLLIHLIHLNYDVEAAYETAIERLVDEGIKTLFRSLSGKHERHIRELSERVVQLGGKPATHGDFRAVIERARVAVAALSGDLAIVQAMRTNEEVTTRGYLETQAHAGLCEATRDVLDRAIADQQRCDRELDEVLSAFPRLG